ncbi:MAG: hypothetical protein ACTSRB_02245 [Candidatus Helarchaeota archaeon]
MSRINLKFCVTWDRRLNLSVGGEDPILDAMLSRIPSWSAALALIDDWQHCTQ